MPIPKNILTLVQTALTVGLVIEVSAVFGVCAFPGVYGCLWLWDHTAGFGREVRLLLLCMGGGLAYFVFGFSQMIVLPVARWVTFATGSPLGKYPLGSWKGYQWVSYNALTLVIRFSFVNWIRGTPFICWYHRMMGMKVGKRVQINAAVVSDQNLIEIGDDSLIGGDVTLIGHAVEHYNVVTGRVKIGKRVTVGLMAVIMPGCEIGDGAMIAANAVLKKDTKIGPGEIWGGVPAKCIGKVGEHKKAVEDAQATTTSG